jgi:hypothetical protein
MDRRPRKPTERAREAAAPRKKAPSASPSTLPTDEEVQEATTPEYREAPLAPPEENTQPEGETPEYQEAPTLPIVHAVPLTERVAHAVLAIPVGETTKNPRTHSTKKTRVKCTRP